MRGTFNFYQDDRLVHTAPNLITDLGKQSILRFLAGQNGQFGRCIAVGAGDAPAAVTDTRLTLEFDRANVSVSSPNYNTNSIVYKCTLAGLSVGRIYEVGLYENSISNNPNTNILTFDPGLEPWTGGTADGEFSRLGPNSLRVDAATNGSATATVPFLVDIASYDMNDVFSLAFWVTDSNTSSLTLRFRADNTANYYQATATPTQGFNIVNFSKSTLTKTGTLEFNEITSVEVRVNAKATDTALDPLLFPNGLGYTGTRVHLDALTVLGKNQRDDTNILISHSVIGGYVSKIAGRPVDVEYVMDLNL